MTFHALTQVRAARDIQRGPHTLVKTGWPGKIVDSHRSWFETTYTVEFTPEGRKHQGGVTLIGLSEDDVKPELTNDTPADPLP